ncbi:hypothetical protein [Anaeromicropila populeti]|nr:hypothetical protein [Anaeromicropila populeti]
MCNNDSWRRNLLSGKLGKLLNDAKDKLVMGSGFYKGDSKSTVMR